MKPHLLSVKNLSIDFDTSDGIIRVVDGVEFNLNAGECIGIVGESGSGKSMTSLALLRLIPGPHGKISTGSIELDGKDINQIPVQEMRSIRGKEIAMVFQEPMSSLNPVMTIGDQIEEALLLHESLEKTARKQRVIEILSLVGIPNPIERLGSYPHEFSGGMRQRVMIAMALSCNPKILVADEPTTALDVTIQAQVLDLLKNLRKQFNTAIILISHDFGVISDIADRVFVMYCGRIVESATIDTIFSSPAHPYTEGLLKSIPSKNNLGRLYQIPGQVPSPTERGKGCDFFDRCTKQMSKCSQSKPRLETIHGTHAVACFAVNTQA